MSLSRETLPPRIASDAAFHRYLELIRADIEPDPLFRRRLRGVVVNEFVASREGLTGADAGRPSRMGRLGRACLYASFALVLSVGGVMAASRSALPGDPLYPVKLHVEHLRFQVLPAHLHDELAVYTLSERINELGRLTEAGDWAGAASMAGEIEDGYAKLASIGATEASDVGELGSRLEVLEALMDRLPPSAHDAIRRAMQSAPGLNGTAPGIDGSAPGVNRGADGNSAGGNSSNGDVPDEAGSRGTPSGAGAGPVPSDDRPRSGPTVRPTPSPKPSTEPESERTEPESDEPESDEPEVDEPEASQTD